MAKEGIKKCVYDLTLTEVENFDNLIKILGTSKVGMLRELITPGPLQEAFIKLWQEQKEAK